MGQWANGLIVSPLVNPTCGMRHCMRLVDKHPRSTRERMDALGPWAHVPAAMAGPCGPKRPAYPSLARIGQPGARGPLRVRAPPTMEKSAMP